MASLSVVETFLIWVVPVLFAITVHEWAHGYTANMLGDDTARMLGRLSLNPVKHIDLVGTIAVPSILFFSSGFLFGWAKPVPVNISALRDAKNSAVLVALAGPSANIVMAAFWSLMAFLAVKFNIEYLLLVGIAGVQINIILAVLNLLPIPPLDGSRLVERLLPTELKYYYRKIEPYGFIVLILLLLTGILSQLILPTVNFLVQLFIIN